MHILIKVILGFIVSFYLFPFGLTFLPPTINTKMIVAILGMGVFALDYMPITKLKIKNEFLGSLIIAIVFSVICLISIDYNNTDDYTYASYISSFFVWVFGAYFVTWCLRSFYGSLSFRILGYYLLGVCFTQCILAILINSVPAVKIVVDTYVSQGQEFLNEIERLYGIGAALDPAGVRFCVVLLITAALLSKDENLRGNKINLAVVLIGFFGVGFLGNMISRTTSIGFGLSIFYILSSSQLLRSTIKINSVKVALIYIIVLTFVISTIVYLYNTNQNFYQDIRFAFEGFFNWVETGVWRTDSTDKLNQEMWIWPEETKDWIIGTGLFGNFIYSTDIGYCRLILYCGIIGFSAFALLFVYNAIFFMIKVPKYGMLFFLLGVLTFLIWIKVATDIFFIYAMLYCVDTFAEDAQASTIEIDVR